MSAIPESEWRWFGHAGHYIVARSCLHHLHTRVGNFRISTVGDYRYPHDASTATEVGFDRLYETYVFRLDGECAQCDPPCHQGEVADWCEIDSLPANDATAAEANHMALCRKYAEVTP